MRATIPDELRGRLIGRVMARDRMTKETATHLVNRLAPHELIRLEMETLEHERPAFTSDYDPFARG